MNSVPQRKHQAQSYPLTQTKDEETQHPEKSEDLVHFTVIPHVHTDTKTTITVNNMLNSPQFTTQHDNFFDNNIKNINSKITTQNEKEITDSLVETASHVSSECSAPRIPVLVQHNMIRM